MQWREAEDTKLTRDARQQRQQVSREYAWRMIASRRVPRLAERLGAETLPNRHVVNKCQHAL